MQLENLSKTGEPTGGKWKKIVADEITHITVAKPLCKIWVNNNTKAYTVRASLDEVLLRFKNPQMIRMHKSHAVQVYFIDKYDAKSCQIFLKNGLQLAVGRTYKNELPRHIMFLE